VIHFKNEYGDIDQQADKLKKILLTTTSMPKV
jgi:hypothetical protein